MEGEFRAACEQLHPLVSEARRLSPLIAAGIWRLQDRHETIFLMARGGGKTEIGSCSAFGQDEPLTQDGGYLDDKGMPDNELARLVMGMMKLHREQRGAFPNYNPKILLRPETWGRIKARFHWLEPHHVARIEFPAHCFYESLKQAGATNDALVHFPMGWLNSSRDTSGSILPGVAFDAMANTCKLFLEGNSVAFSKWRGFAEASAKHVQQQEDLSYWLTFMAAGDEAIYTRGRKYSLSLERIGRRIRQARKQNPDKFLPYDMTAPEFIDMCSVAGVWKVSSNRYAAWAPVYSVGASFLKASLTDAAFKRMLRK